MRLLVSSVRAKGRLQPPRPATFSYNGMTGDSHALGQLCSPLSESKALGSALLHPGAPRGWGNRNTGEQQSPAACPICCSGLAAFGDNPGCWWESRGHPSSLLPPAPPGAFRLLGLWIGLGAAPAEEASCPCCWQWLRSFFPCDKYGNRVCTRSELGINSISQIGES